MTPNALLFAAKNALLNDIAVAVNGAGENELTC